MAEVIRHLVWMCLICCGIAYAIFVVVGSAIHNREIDASRLVSVRDVYRPGEHNLSGMVMVPETCKQLALHTDVIDSKSFELRFTTWQEPYVDCKPEDTPRFFRAVVFAPAVGIQFYGTLDGSPLDMVVLPQKGE